VNQACGSKQLVLTALPNSCTHFIPFRLFDFDKSDEFKAYMRNVELPPGDKALLKVKAKWYKRLVVSKHCAKPFRQPGTLKQRLLAKLSTLL
jgi:hypothetical protein